jgi:hypothetical protein
MLIISSSIKVKPERSKTVDDQQFANTLKLKIKSGKRIKTDTLFSSSDKIDTSSVKAEKEKEVKYESKETKGMQEKILDVFVPRPSTRSYEKKEKEKENELARASKRDNESLTRSSKRDNESLTRSSKRDNESLSRSSKKERETLRYNVKRL